MQAGNTCCFLQQSAACLRLSRDKFTNASLPDHRRRSGTGGHIGEQELHILGADILAIDAIHGTGFALDAARYLQLVGVVEGGRCFPGRIVEEQRHFRHIA